MQDSEIALSHQSRDQRMYAQLLRRVDLFAGLDRVTLAKFASHLEPLFYSAPSIIFRQGDVGDALYMVASGTVGVYASDSTGLAETRVKLLGAGEPFGEMALLNNIPRTATIKVESDCEVLRLDRSAFIELVREQPSVALAIAAMLSRRLADMLNQPGGKDADAAAVAASSPAAQSSIQTVAPTNAVEAASSARGPTLREACA